MAVDHDGSFPFESIEALKSAGLLGALSSLESGGLGLGLAGAARIVRRVAEECGSTAMVLTMHYCGVAVLEAHGPIGVRRDAASGAHLSTLAFSEAGSRSHFWSPASTAKARNGHVVLNAAKSWVTSASRATGYVWSSKPLAAEGLSTIWLVPASSRGMEVRGTFEGLGLRGNDSLPVTATDVEVPPSAMLGSDGQGFEIMMSVVLPVFAVLNAACSNGLMAGGLRRTAEHAGSTRHSDTGASLADLPTIRNYIARMQVKADMSNALLSETLDAIAEQRPNATLRVLESKAAAGETANEVLDLAMRVCGGAAFRKDVGVERYFRDARAAGIMAPTTDVLYDFIGKAVCGMPLF
ncbi:MAG: acyl-CoA dehydrogenase [Bryobacteraceae bacterium]